MAGHFKFHQKPCGLQGEETQAGSWKDLEGFPGLKKIGTTTASFIAVGKVAVFRERLNKYDIEFEKNGANSRRKRILMIGSEVNL